MPENFLQDISFGQLLLRLFQTARRFNMEVQPQLVLLQKTLLNIEGLGRQIYPDLDLWQTAKPFLEKWMNEQIGAKAILKGFKKNLPYIAEKMPDMPVLLFSAIKKIADGENYQLQADAIEKLNKKIETGHKKISYILIGLSGFIVSAIILGQPSGSHEIILDAPVLSWLSAAIGFVFVWLGMKKQ